MIDFDIDLKEIEQAIENTSEEIQQKVKVDDYAVRIKELLDSLKSRYGYNDLDAMLVLKDILAHLL